MWTNVHFKNPFMILSQMIVSTVNIRTMYGIWRWENALLVRMPKLWIWRHGDAFLKLDMWTMWWTKIMHGSQSKKVCKKCTTNLTDKKINRTVLFVLLILHLLWMRNARLVLRIWFTPYKEESVCPFLTIWNTIATCTRLFRSYMIIKRVKLSQVTFWAA